MAQQPAPAGFFYTSGGQSLRANGNDATWIDGGGALHHCQDVTSLNGNNLVIPPPAQR